jgi:hypothetical protein
MKAMCFVGLTGLVLLAAGCPPVVQVSPGVWIINLDNADFIGVELFADGSAANPDPLPAGATQTFPGTVTWTQVGTQFTLTHALSGQSFFFNATVTDPNALSGVRTRTGGSNVVPFTAERVE